MYAAAKRTTTARNLQKNQLLTQLAKKGTGDVTDPPSNFPTFMPLLCASPVQDIIISALPQGCTAAPDGQSAFGLTVFNSEAKFSLRLLRPALVL